MLKIEPIYIYHHMGLGDHLICNGLVRNFYNKIQPSVWRLFVKPEYLDTVQFMYRDLNNLGFVVGYDHQVEQFINFKTDIVKIGFHQMNTLSGHFDERFYKLANMPFSERWDKFHYTPDLERETALFNKLNLEEGKYIFVHDDHTRNLTINPTYIIDKSLPIIRPDSSITNNIFDWLTVIRKAKEIHMMDSCFFHLVEIPSLQTTDLIFYHAYLKGYSLEGMPSFRKKWIVI